MRASVRSCDFRRKVRVHGCLDALQVPITVSEGVCQSTITKRRFDKQAYEMCGVRPIAQWSDPDNFYRLAKELASMEKEERRRALSISFHTSEEVKSILYTGRYRRQARRGRVTPRRRNAEIYLSQYVQP